jgi:phosphinothricin acetyltransferase
MNFKELTQADWPRVKEIYAMGMEDSLATFETQIPEYAEWDAAHIKTCRIAALSRDYIAGEGIAGDGIAGWAVLSPVSKRRVYRGVAEVSIYLDKKFRGAGIGAALLCELIRVSEKNGFWTLESSIFPENIPSVKLHEKCGFRIVGRREKLGKDKYGVWRDTILMERRSSSFLT